VSEHPQLATRQIRQEFGLADQYLGSQQLCLYFARLTPKLVLNLSIFAGQRLRVGPAGAAQQQSYFRRLHYNMQPRNPYPRAFIVWSMPYVGHVQMHVQINMDKNC